MQQEVRFGDYVQEVGICHELVSYNDVVAASPSDARLRLRPAEVVTILTPYISPRFLEQFRAVAPLALYLVSFQLLFLRQPVESFGTIAGALLAVIVGLMLFMEGLKLGLMPLGERMGETLPTHQPILVVSLVVFLLGIGVTFAEPAIGALKAAGAIVSAQETPVLFALSEPTQRETRLGSRYGRRRRRRAGDFAIRLQLEPKAADLCHWCRASY